MSAPKFSNDLLLYLTARQFTWVASLDRTTPSPLSALVAIVLDDYILSMSIEVRVQNDTYIKVFEKLPPL